MTSYYDYEWEFKTTKPNEVAQALDKESWSDQNSDSSYDKTNSTLTISGEASFHTGATEANHKEICELVKKVDPNAKVITRWHCNEGWDWDNEYEDGISEDKSVLDPFPGVDQSKIISEA